MELEQKIELNKQIRKYNGSNSFVLSLQKQLKTNKYLSKVEWKGKEVKILSDKQYQAAIDSLL
jgi:tRNA1(Val) A37 N6-methylase TrmN6